MGRLDGRVAFVAGAARGQGRSHCLKLASEGADIIAFDVCAPMSGVPYPASTPADLAETVRQVEALNRRIVHAEADVRDGAAVQKLLDHGIAELGRVDIVSAQVGLSHIPMALHEVPEDSMAVNDRRHPDRHLEHGPSRYPAHDRRRPGRRHRSDQLVAAIRGYANVGHYVAAKHGLIGIVRTLSAELGPHNIRVTSIAPTNCATDMLLNQESYDLFRPDKEPGTTTRAEFEEAARAMHSLPIPYVEPIDISNALMFLVSDEARYITGITLPVDGGATQY